jgi:predicted DNA-binding protein (MmcQ/YjbR family)
MREDSSSAPLFTGKAFNKYQKLFLSKPGARETFPFGPQVAVYKTKAGKMFATLSADGESWSGNLKCDPHWSLTLRKQYPGSIEPGYHMNKKHWNTVLLNGALPPALIRKLVDLSFALVSPVTRK